MSSGLWGMLNGRRKTPALGLLFGCFVSGGLWNIFSCPTLTPRCISLLQPGVFGWDFPLVLAMVNHQGLPCILKLWDCHHSFIYCILKKGLEHGSAHSWPWMRLIPVKKNRGDTPHLWFWALHVWILVVPIDAAKRIFFLLFFFFLPFFPPCSWKSM